VRYRELNETRRRQIRYGALALAILLLAAGVIAFSHSTQHTTANPDGATPRRTAQATPPAPAPSQASADDLNPTISGLRRDEAVTLIGEARRQAAAGNFVEADAALQKAQKVAAGLAEIEQARRDIEQLRSPEGSFTDQMQRARLAIDHDDRAAAEAALAEASRLKPGAPEVAALRAAFQQAQEKTARREARIAEALARMREAVARRDFAAADRALNEAERIDIQSPSIRRARGELARARGALANNPE
jgi:hypothetical protein